MPGQESQPIIRPAPKPSPATLLLEPVSGRDELPKVPENKALPKELPSPSAILLPPVHGETMQERRDRLDREDRLNRIDAFYDILKKHKIIGLRDYEEKERGRRLGCSGYNPCLIPHDGAISSNFSLDRLEKTGVCVFLPGIPVEGIRGVRGYCESTVVSTGRPTILMVNTQHGLLSGDHTPGPMVNIALGIRNGGAALRNSQWGRMREPSIDATADLVFDLLKQNIPVRIIAHSQGTANTPPVFAALAERFAAEAWRGVPRDVDELSARKMMISAYRGYWDKVREMVTVDAYGPVQLRYHHGIQVHIRAFEDDPIYFVGRFANMVKSSPIHPLVVDKDIGIPTRGGLTELPGGDHDYDAHIDELHKFIISETTRGSFSQSSGRALAARFYEIAANAEYSDKTLKNILDSVASRWNRRETQGFVLAFRDQLNFEFQADEKANTSERALRPGSIGKFQISESNRKFFGLADYNPNRPYSDEALQGLSRRGYQR